jgi:hypothetical protein
MSYFAVLRDAGPAWTDGKGTFDQPGVSDHAMFMDGLGDQGFVLLPDPSLGASRDASAPW